MVQLSLNLTLACIRLVFVSVMVFWKLACCSSVSDNTQENMHANLYWQDTQHLHSSSCAVLVLTYITSERVSLSSFVTLNTNLIKNAHMF